MSALVRALGGQAAVALVVFLWLAILLFRKTWLAPQTSWIGGCCDPEQGMWFLRWIPYAIGHLQNPWYTVSINYPTGVNLMWNPAIQLPGLLLWPVSVTQGPIVAYNVYITLSVGLSAWCAYLALRRYTSGHLGPFIGGTVYGFSPYVLSHALQHADLTCVAILPLLLLLLDEIVVRQRYPAVRVGIVLGLLAVAQLLVAAELLAIAALVGVMTLVTLAALQPRQIPGRLPYAARAAGWAVATFVLLAAWPLAVQFIGPQRITGAVHEPDVFVTDLLNFVVPTSVQALAPQSALKVVTTFTGLEHEDTAYLGFPLLVLLCFVAGRLWKRLPIRVAAIVALGVAVLSLGPHVHVAGQVTGLRLPWSWVARLPLMENVLTSRLTVFVYLGAGLLLALFVDGAAGRSSGATVAALSATAIALIPLFPRQPFPAWTVSIPPYFMSWQESRIPDGSVVLVAPRSHDGAGAIAMVWQAETGDAFRMPNGYLLQPDAKGERLYDSPGDTISTVMDNIEEQGAMAVLDAPTRQAIERDLRAHHVDDVIVGPMDHRDLMLRFFGELFGQQPEVTGGVAVWRRVQVALAAGPCSPCQSSLP